LRHRPRKHSFALISACLVWGTAAAFAQVGQPLGSQGETPLDPLEQLLKIRIESATKTSHPLSEAPGILTIFTAKDIEDSGARTLADLLKRIPGVQIGDNRANVQMVWIRGVTTTYNEKILLIIDGIPKRDATLSEWAPDERIDLQNIERIEIIRGPGSAVHGGNAYAGVISIYTKKEPGRTRLAVSGGSEGTGEASIRGGAESGDLTLVYAARVFKTDGYLSERGLKGGPSDNTNARLARNLQLSGSLGPKWSFDLMGGDLDYRYPMHEVNSKRDANYAFALGGISYQEKRDRASWTTRFYFDNTKISFNEVVKNPDQSLNQIKDQAKQGLVLGLDSQCAYDFTRDLHLLLGVNAEKNKATYLEEEWNPTSTDPNKIYYINSWFSQNGEGAGRNTAGTWNYSTFLQGEARLPDHGIGLTAGGRYDRFEGFGGEFSPRIGFVIAPQESTAIKALWGRAFRPPTFRQLYVVRYDGFQPGDPNLRPERANTYEAEVSQRLGGRTNLRLGYFNTVLKDTTVTIANSRWQNSPIPRKLSGLEMELRTEFQPNLASLRSVSLFLNGARLLKAYDETPLGRVDVASVAPTTANLGMTLRSWDFTFFTAFNYVGRRNAGYAYDPATGTIVYTYHSQITADNLEFKLRDNKGAYVIQDLTLGWKDRFRPFKLELIVRNLWDKLHYNPTHDPDYYYDVLMERRQVDLRLSIRY